MHGLACRGNENKGVKSYDKNDSIEEEQGKKINLKYSKHNTKKVIIFNARGTKIMFTTLK
jgi:hypothetical protein